MSIYNMKVKLTAFPLHVSYRKHVLRLEKPPPKAPVWVPAAPFGAWMILFDDVL